MPILLQPPSREWPQPKQAWARLPARPAPAALSQWALCPPSPATSERWSRSPAAQARRSVSQERQAPLRQVQLFLPLCPTCSGHCMLSFCSS